jgi:hypothetical protein
MNGIARIHRSGREAERPDLVTSVRGDMIMSSFSPDTRDAQSHYVRFAPLLTIPHMHCFK